MERRIAAARNQLPDDVGTATITKADISALPVPMADHPRHVLHVGEAPPGASYPVTAVSYLGSQAGGGIIFNDYVWGGYLIYELFPRYRVVIDGRTDLYGPLVGLHLRAVRAEPGWRRFLDIYDVDFVLVARDRPLADILTVEPGWRLVVEGDVERLFARAGTDAVQNIQPGPVSADP